MKYGIFGTALATTLPAIFSVSLFILCVSKIIGEKFITVIKTLFNPFISSLAMISSILLVKCLIIDISSLLHLILLVLIGSTTYFGVMLLLPNGLKLNKEQIKLVRR